MQFETIGKRSDSAVLFFHAMGVNGASSEPVARRLQERYYCVLPTSTVYCAGQKYAGKADEVRQVEEFLRAQGVKRLALIVASSIGADLAMAFLTRTSLPVEHAFFDGGQFAQIGRELHRIAMELMETGNVQTVKMAPEWNGPMACSASAERKKESDGQLAGLSSARRTFG